MAYPPMLSCFDPDGVPQWPAPANVRARCSTRTGGVSAPPYASLNLGDHVGDAASAVQHNRQHWQQTLGAKAVFLQQVHGSSALELTADTPSGVVADAAYTRTPGLACTVLVADCLPILLCDRRGSVVAAVHAGWRGLAGTDGVGILESVFRDILATAPVDIAGKATEFIAWLGPCIGPQAFEVGPEVVAAFTTAQPAAHACFQLHGAGKWLADLPALARLRLHALGVAQVFGNDGSADWCTVQQPQRFYSYRRDGRTGRLAAAIWLAT